MKKIVKIALVATMVSACGRAPISITEKEVFEVCLDNAGYQEAEISNLEMNRDNHFYVSFDVNEKHFSYDVNSKGLIEDRLVKHTETIKDVIKVEPTAEAPEVLIDIQQVNEVDEQCEEVKKIALENSLINLGLTTEMIQDATVTNEADGTYTVHFWVTDYGTNWTTVTDSLGDLINQYPVE